MPATVNQRPFQLGAASNLTTTQTQSGDLVVSGLACSFHGIDRQGEQFLKGSLSRSIKGFLSNPSGAPLCWHHDRSKPIGTVLDLRESDRGLEFKALVARQEPESPLYWIYSGVKRGLYKGVSIGGYFKRKLVEGGFRISSADLTEISLTAVPSFTGTYANVEEVKAILEFCDGGSRQRMTAEELGVHLDLVTAQLDLYALRESLRRN